MRRFRVTQIKWDTDGQQIKLPDELVVLVNDEEDISDAVTNEYGFCHFGFEYEEEDDPELQ